MSYVPYQDLQTYRLPGAAFPLRFTMHGQQWQLENGYVEGAGHWRCMLRGPKLWYVCAGSNQRDIEHQLREVGIQVPAKTFPGTAFRHLVSLGSAERLADLPPMTHRSSRV